MGRKESAAQKPIHAVKTQIPVVLQASFAIPLPQPAARKAAKRIVIVQALVLAPSGSAIQRATPAR